MASSSVTEDQSNEKKLLDIFDEGYDLFEKVSSCEEPTNSVCVQTKVKQAMRLFEDATRLTSLAGVFSVNETVDEVATDNLRLFLMPALLGMLALKLTGTTNRLEVVEASDTYFRDFLERCNRYEISNVEIPPPIDLECKIEEDTGAPKRPVFDLMNVARNRASKIARYKEEKALEEEVAKLGKVVKSEQVDEDIKREYYLKFIKYYVGKSLEELDCLQSEKRILAHMKAVQKNETMTGVEEQKRKTRNIPPPKPLKAVIITRDEVQKAVYGAGYPSLPTMTVQEFYDQRVKDGIFPDEKQVQANSLQAKALMGKSANDEEDEDRAEKEALVERDDERELARLRAMDDFKDNTKRGSGNRYNRS